MNAHELIKMLPERYQPDLLDGAIQSMIHIIISNEEGHETEYSVELENESCKVFEELKGVADCTIRALDKDYADVELGRTNAQWALLTSKIECDNIMELIRFIGYFRRIRNEED